MILGWKLFWTKEHKDSLGEFLTEFYSTEHKITARNITTFSRGEIYRPSLKAEMLKDSE